MNNDTQINATAVRRMNDCTSLPLTPGPSPRCGARGAKPALVAAFLLLSAFAGCGEPGNFEPSFRLNNQGLNPTDFRVTGREENEEEKKDKELNIEARQYMADALQAMFGTPDRPFVFRESGLDLKKIRMASGPAGGLPRDVQQADLTALKKQENELKKAQPALDADVKKYDADLATNLASFAASKGLADVKTPADLKEQEAAFREQFKAVYEAKAGADLKLAEAAGALADLSMQINSYGVAQKGLYRQHCAHCHGTTGDGAGPTAAFLTPYPRDYRQGVYKFKATQRAARPMTADLHRVLIDGINDTAMPSFALLPPDEVDALVEYVRYLSIRGEVESYLKGAWLEDRKVMKPSRTELVKTALQPVVDEWVAAETAVIAPGEAYSPDADQKAWLKAGADLFAGDKAKCFSCHGTQALGDGRKVSEPVYDIWNKDKAKTATDLAAADAKGDAAEATRLANILSSYSLPVQAQKPRNLRLGKYRFGRRPIDLYRRIYAGVNGTEMPGGGPPTPGAKATLSDKEIWQLVDYVLSLPYALDTHAPTVKTEHHATHAAPQVDSSTGGGN